MANWFWGYCPVCYKERRVNTSGELKPHRKYVAYVKAAMARDRLPGRMVWCSGSGMRPVMGTRVRSMVS